jgi:hypothetical protein
MLATALIAIGMMLLLVGYIWLGWVALQESVPWGLGTFLFPLIGIVFAIYHWGEAKAPILTSIAGNVLIFVRVAVRGANG